jgi:hypothetical protein
MGGFAIDTSDAEHPFLPEGRMRLTLTPYGVQCIAELEPELIPNISKEDIDDKSKASGLAKTIVCFQALWFCLQCLIRLGRGLPITLLELNTFVHALCTIITYWLWWDKPLDVSEPTIIKGQHKNELAALFSLADIRKSYFPVLHPPGCGLEAKDQGKAYLHHLGTSGTVTPHPQSFPFKLDPHQQIHGYFYRLHISQRRYRAFCRCDPRSYYIELSEVDVIRAKLASQYIRRIIGFRTKDCKPRNFEHWLKEFTVSINIDQSLLSQRIRNWPDVSAFAYLSFFKRSGMPKPVAVGFSLAGVAYGLLHLSAWGAPFPSKAQMMLWKISGLTLISSGPALVFIVCLSHFFQGSLWIFGSFEKRMAKVLFSLFLLFPASYALLYVVSRVYLLVECFINLSYLPASAFKVPGWSGYVPHIS